MGLMRAVTYGFRFKCQGGTLKAALGVMNHSLRSAPIVTAFISELGSAREARETGLPVAPDKQAVSPGQVPPVPAFAEGKCLNRRFQRDLIHTALVRIAGSQSRLRRDQDPAKPHYDTASRSGPEEISRKDRWFDSAHHEVMN